VLSLSRKERRKNWIILQELKTGELEMDKQSNKDINKDKKDINKEKLAAGYKSMAARIADALKEFDKNIPVLLHDLIEKARQSAIELGELTEEEAEKVSEYLRRDLEDAATFVDKTGHEIKDWLSFDVLLVEKELWDLFSSVADKTTVELLQFKQSVPPQKYHSQEIVGMGGLKCVHCGETLEFYHPAPIPPCPNCQGTLFERNVSRRS
jgi:hypothetical protein